MGIASRSLLWLNDANLINFPLADTHVVYVMPIIRPVTVYETLIRTDNWRAWENVN